MFEDLFEGFKWRWVIIPLVILIILATALGCFYTVGEQEQAVITTMGRVTRVDSAGLYFKLPYVQSRTIVNTTIERMEIGYKTDKRGDYITNETEGVMITSDFNLVNIDFFMEYRVSNAVNYLYQSDDPEKILRNIALACIRNVVSSYTVDEVITTEKYKIQQEVKDAIANVLRNHDIGLQIVNITIQDAVAPTKEVIAAFNQVETAKQQREMTINIAKQYRAEQIPLAESKADGIIKKAEAIKQTRIAEAQGQLSRFSKIYDEYKNAQAVTKKRLLYEAMEEIFPNIKIVVKDSDVTTVFPLEKFSE